ncbi:uncharacterized protein V1518DRAFT_416285 [Limtongia smithiae]|uniref:uncharacterized protein n=1 Tax=Limtongia smithiae TaxID=1125753 RepID=UPI0034CD1DA4
MDAIDPAALDPIRLDLLQQFMTVTTWADDDAAGAAAMLAICDWNVELALTRYFDEGPIRPASIPVSPSQARRGAPGAPRIATPPAPPPDIAPRIPEDLPPRTLGASSLIARVLASVVLFPLSLVSRVAYAGYSLASLIFPFLPRLTGLYPANLGAARATRRSVNPRDTAARFIREFEESVGGYSAGEDVSSSTGVVIPPFFEGGYTSALDTAKRDLRFLLVVLQSDQHDDTLRFNRDVLCDSSVLRIFKEHNFLVWGGNVRESEAYQVANALSCTRYPFLALIAFSPASASHPASMTIHARLQGLLTPPALAAHINTVLARHEPVLSRVRAQRAEQDLAREIRAQQDSAYEASLAADREREQLRAEQEQRERERIEELERIENERLSAEARVATYRAWRAHVLREQMPPATTTARVARISIRLTSGERVVARFREDQSVDDVYAYIDCYVLLTDSTDATAAPPSSPPSGYTHTYTFNLVSPYPRAVLSPDATKLIRDERVLWPNGNLIVEDIEAYDEDEPATTS